MKILIAVLAAAVLAGCGGVRYPTTYLLNVPPPVTQPATRETALGSVGVREFRCPEYVCEGRIVYRPSAEEVGFYEYHRWAVSPRQAVTQFVADSLRAQSLFKSVAVHERGTAVAYVLSGSIDRLEELDQGRDVQAFCRISAQLTDARTGSVVWTHTVSETVPVQTRNVAGVVSSMSEAIRIAVDQLVASAASELASRQTLTIRSE